MLPEGRYVPVPTATTEVGHQLLVWLKKVPERPATSRRRGKPPGVPIFPKVYELLRQAYRLSI